MGFLKSFLSTKNVELSINLWAFLYYSSFFFKEDDRWATCAFDEWKFEALVLDIKDSFKFHY